MASSALTKAAAAEGGAVDELTCAAEIALVAFDQRIKGFVVGAFVGAVGAGAVWWFFVRGKR